MSTLSLDMVRAESPANTAHGLHIVDRPGQLDLEKATGIWLREQGGRKAALFPAYPHVSISSS
jgi:hypothetical protein